MNKVFSKVIAAGAGAGAGAIVSTFATWLIGLGFGGSSAASEVDATMALAPLPLVGVAGLVLTVGGAVLGGFLKSEDTEAMRQALARQVE